MSNNEGVYVFPDAMAKASGIDPNLLLALQNNGGFGNNGNWMWVLFLWLIWGNNGWGGNGFGGNNGTGYLANQISNSEGRDLLLQAINGRADAAAQLASITNTSVETVKNGIFSLQSSINQVANQVGMSGLQTINAVQAGNASLGSQIAQCCCENRLAIANQTAALQSTAAAHDASVRLQLAQNEAADQLSVCQQTNQLGSQADRNTNNILNAINAQTVAMNDRFCELKERELQNKIDTQGDIITQLAFNSLNEKINILSAKSPNTVPVVYPNLTAVNNTPYGGGFNPWGYGFGGQSYWG